MNIGPRGEICIHCIILLPKYLDIELDNNTVTRGHSLKLKKERVTAGQRRHYFRHRVVNRWNTLTEYYSFSALIKYFQIKTRQILVRLQF